LTVDGHWDWSEGGDDADTADLGDQHLGGGHDLHGDFGGEHYGDDFGGEHLHGGFDGGDEHSPGGHGDQPGHGDLEEPLGTEHAAADYDHALEHGADDEPLSYDEDHHHADIADAGDPAAGDGGHEATFGADPDADPTADDPAWHEAHFPEELHLSDPPEPVDGFPWTDADVLGGPDHDLSAAYDPAAAEPGAPDVTGLVDYAGGHAPAGTDPWSLLIGSDDPAASTLATFWAPQ
jgi:hypothetical protein